MVASHKADTGIGRENGREQASVQTHSSLISSVIKIETPPPPGKATANDTAPKGTVAHRPFQRGRVFLLIGLCLTAFYALGLWQNSVQQNRQRENTTALFHRSMVVDAADKIDAIRNRVALSGSKLPTGQIKKILNEAAIGPKTTLLDLSANRRQMISGGKEDLYHSRSQPFWPKTLAAQDLSKAGVAKFQAGELADKSLGDILVTWRPMADGRLIIALSPARDIFYRLPLWQSHSLIWLALTVLTGSGLYWLYIVSNRLEKATGLIKVPSTVSSAPQHYPQWQGSKDGRQVTLPAILMQQLGYEPVAKTFTRREATIMTHPKDARRVLNLWSGHKTAGTTSQFRLRTKSGDWKWIIALRDEGTDIPCGNIICLGDSPADNEIAAKAKARLNEAIESIPEAFLLWDEYGQLIAWNRKFCNVFGIAPDQVKTGLTAKSVATLAPDYSHLITSYFAPPTDSEEQTSEIELPAGLWGHVARRRTADKGWVCIVSNITNQRRRALAQKRKERELELTVERLEESRAELREAITGYAMEKTRAEEANRAKSEFLAHMSHELRTPLNAINGFSEVMESELYGPLGHMKYKEYIHDILDSGRHLLALIDDILDLSKIEAGRMELEIGPVDIERTLNEGLRLAEPETRSRQIALNASIANLPSAWADTRATKQIFINMLTNAVKFTENGGSVSVTAQADLNSITVLIADTGVGIPPEKISKLGEPFELVESHLSKSRRGSGLGLALSRSLMNLQNGILAIASEPGRGTVVSITLPRRAGVTVSLPDILQDKAHILTGEVKPAAYPQLPDEQREAAE